MNLQLYLFAVAKMYSLVFGMFLGGLVFITYHWSLRHHLLWRPILMPHTGWSPLLENFAAKDYDTVAVIEDLASSQLRGYINDFELSSMLFEAQIFDTRQIWFKVATPDDFSSVDSVAFIIMRSSSSKGKLVDPIWIQLTSIYQFLEFDSKFLRFPQFPVSQTKLFDKTVEWVEEIHNRYSDSNWLVIVDDDVWLNIPVLMQFLYPYNPDLPIIFINMLAPNGVVIYSRIAFSRIATHIDVNGDSFAAKGTTLANTCDQLGILFVHSGQLHSVQPLPINYDLGHIIYQNSSRRDMLKMTCESAKIWRFPLPENCP